MAKNKYLIFLLYLIFFSAFIINEDSLGGAKKDFGYLFGHTLEFNENFFYSLFNYEKTNARHSPIFLIFNSFLLRIIDNDFIIYDVFVYDYDNIHHDLVRFVPNVINIVLVSDTDSDFLNNLISMGADIIIQKDIDDDTIKNTMLICSLINL